MKILAIWYFHYCIHGTVFVKLPRSCFNAGLGVNLSCDDSDICVPSGSVVTCTCTVEDEDGTRSTLWDGTAFMSQCSQSRDQIVLLHSQFDVIEPLECGNRISAIPINQEFRNYTSNASITVNISNNGSSIRCSLAGLSPVGIKLLNVGGKLNLCIVNVHYDTHFIICRNPPTSK